MEFMRSENMRVDTKDVKPAVREFGINLKNKYEYTTNKYI